MKNILRKILPEGIINFYHKCQAVAANIWYGYPSRQMTVIGVTGTNGKTTTCYMISKIFDESGNKNAMIGTVFYKIGDKFIRNNSKMTTLNPFVLQKFLKDAVNKNCRFVIIETSSHAISQYRIWGINYQTLVWTNLTHDHLDYHKNFKNYLNAKLKLFKNNPTARGIVNADDKYAEDVKKVTGGQLITYSLENHGMVNARKIKNFDNGSNFVIDWLGSQVEAKINLVGNFNIANAIAAFCVGLSYNISPRTIVAALENIKTIPGRMERLDFGQDYEIIVDYAHAPDGLQKVFEAVKPTVRGRLIHVAGCTGDRDKTKRPLMGALSGKFADISIVTDEDPGSEKPEDIIESVAAGVPRGATIKNQKILGKNFFKILNRSEAIRLALDNAQKGDVVLITGKGHEQVMKIGDKLVPYSDQEVVKKYFNKKD